MGRSGNYEGGGGHSLAHFQSAGADTHTHPHLTLTMKVQTMKVQHYEIDIPRLQAADTHTLPTMKVTNYENAGPPSPPPTPS